MEYIEGRPFQGPLLVDHALKYAVQICDARIARSSSAWLP